MKKYLIGGLLALGMLSCAQKSAEKMKDTVALNTQGQPVVSPAVDLYSDGRSKMVKTAECRFQVDNLKKSKEEMSAAIRKFSGFIESSDMEFQNPMLEDHLTIRVMNGYFEDLLKEILSQAKYVNFSKVTADDVSDKFVDLESRVKTKREVQKRYEEILRQKTGTIEELLKTEKQIGELQEEIEAVVSQLDHLKEKVRYSTIKLEVYQLVERPVAEISTGSGMTRKFSTAFISGLNGAMNVLVGLTYIWPFLLTGFAVGFVVMLRRRSLKSTAGLFQDKQPRM